MLWALASEKGGERPQLVQRSLQRVGLCRMPLLAALRRSSLRGQEKAADYGAVF